MRRHDGERANSGIFAVASPLERLVQTRPQVDPAETSPLGRRWSKRSQILIVSGLVIGVVLLAAAAVRFARTTGLVLHAVDNLGEVDPIAPDRPSLRGTSVTPPRTLTTRVGAAPTTPAAPATATAAARSDAPAAPPTAAPTPPPNPESNGGESAAVDAAPVGGASGTGGGDAAAGIGGSGGSGGATPTFWESVVQSALDWIGQTTVTMCGPNTCNTGMVCCNASCGTCVAPGATCDKSECAGAPRTPTSIRCGMGQCNDGQVCCNPSCGICAAPGETCSDAPCP